MDQLVADCEDDDDDDDDDDVIISATAIYAWK